MKTSLIVVVSLITLLTSCKKNGVENPPVTPPVIVPPPIVETLSAGWTKKYIGSSSDLIDIFFNSPANGYIVGSKIYKTVNGGVTWTVVNPGSQSYNIFVTADDKAFFVDGIFLLKTLNGGVQFTQQNLGNQIQDLFFTDNTIGYCTTFGGLFTTSDGGVTWDKIITTGLTIDPSGYSSLFFSNNSTGWICTGKSIYKTSGSNANWQQSVIAGPTLGSFNAIYASSFNTIYAATSEKEIFKSTDGGSNFSLVKKFPGNGFSDLHFINDNIGYFSNNNSIYKTVDGGINWSLVVQVNYRISELHFTDSMHGWASADSGIVLTYKP